MLGITSGVFVLLITIGPEMSSLNVELRRTKVPPFDLFQYLFALQIVSEDSSMVLIRLFPGKVEHVNPQILWKETLLCFSTHGGFL